MNKWRYMDAGYSVEAAVATAHDFNPGSTMAVAHPHSIDKIKPSDPAILDERLNLYCIASIHAAKTRRAATSAPASSSSGRP